MGTEERDGCKYCLKKNIIKTYYINSTELMILLVWTIEEENCYRNNVNIKKWTKIYLRWFVSHHTFLISLSLSLKTEKKLQSILQQWEEDHSRHFIVNDQRYLDDVESRWDNYHQAKEEEKLKRVSHKTQNVTFNNLLATNQSWNNHDGNEVW